MSNRAVWRDLSNRTFVRPCSSRSCGFRATCRTVIMGLQTSSYVRRPCSLEVALSSRNLKGTEGRCSTSWNCAGDLSVAPRFTNRALKLPRFRSLCARWPSCSRSSPRLASRQTAVGSPCLHLPKIARCLATVTGIASLYLHSHLSGCES